MAALRHADGLLVLFEDGLIAAVSVQIQVINGVLLTFGPQTLPRDIAAYRREHVQAHAP